MYNHGYMEKMQILFPKPKLTRLRELARRQDRPVSEVVRAAGAWGESSLEFGRRGGLGIYPYSMLIVCTNVGVACAE